MFCSVMAPLPVPSPPLAFASSPPMEADTAGSAAAAEAAVSFLAAADSDMLTFVVAAASAVEEGTCADTKDVMQLRGGLMQVCVVKTN